MAKRLDAFSRKPFLELMIHFRLHPKHKLKVVGVVKLQLEVQTTTQQLPGSSGSDLSKAVMDIPNAFFGSPLICTFNFFYFLGLPPNLHKNDLSKKSFAPGIQTRNFHEFSHIFDIFWVVSLPANEAYVGILEPQNTMSSW